MSVTTENIDELPEVSYTVDNLLLKLGMSGQVELWKKLDAIIRVQGKVSRMRVYNDYAYFNLSGASGTIRVKCPSDKVPNDQEEIVIEGIVTMTTRKHGAGLDVNLEGQPVARVEAPEGLGEYTEILKTQFLKLGTFIETSGIDNLVVFGSQTAINDVQSKLSQDTLTKLQFRPIVVSNQEKIIKELKDEVQNVAAFAIVRGGDDESLKIWDDPEFVREIVSFEKPFYVALGHAHKMVFICQYADESFATPTAFGVAISETIERELYFAKVSKQIEQLVNEHKDTIAEVKNQHAQELQKLSRVNESKLIEIKKENDKNHEERINTLKEEYAKLTSENTQKQDAIRDEYLKREEESESKRNERFDQLLQNHKQEMNDIQQEKKQQLSNLMAKNSALELELGKRKSRKPVLEWFLISILISIIVFLFLKL